MNETEMKNSALWYEARNAIANGSYLKAKTKTLRKYLSELNIVQPYESDPLAHLGPPRKQEWIAKIIAELQRRKDEHWASFHSYKRGIIIGLIVTVLGGIILFFAFQDAKKKEYQEKTKMLLPQQTSPHQQVKTSLPSPIPMNKDNDQDNQTRK